MKNKTPLLILNESREHTVEFEPLKVTSKMLKAKPDYDINKLKKATIPILVALTISTVLYTYLQAFYPLYMDQKFPTLTSVHFSIILATFEVA